MRLSAVVGTLRREYTSSTHDLYADAVRSRLTSLDAAKTLLQLAGAIYPPGSWITVSKLADTSQEDFMESWSLRSGLSNWAWRTIEELKDDGQ